MGPKSRANSRRVLFTLWQSCTARENPVTLTAKPNKKRGDTEILKLAQLRLILANIDELAIPAVAIAAFGGLRVAGISRLSWSDVDLASGFQIPDAAASFQLREIS